METNKTETDIGAETSEETSSEGQKSTGTAKSAPADGAATAGPSVADLKNELLYMRAEMDNYKKRVLKEQDQAVKYANEKLVKELLTPIDYLDRALSSAKQAKTKGEAEFNNLVSGVDMTQRELIQLLARFGVEFIGAVGEKFNPAQHEAISQKESAEVEPDTVVEVLQKGCLLQGRLLKPARVVVSVKKH